RVRSNIYLCEGDTCWKAADRIPYASGLAYSPLHRRLYVAVAFRKAVWVYQEGGEPVKLRYIHRIRLPGYPDNLTYVNDTLLWTVCHRRLSQWARSLAFGKGNSPWSIVEIRLLPEGGHEVRLLYTSRRGYSTASGALPVGEYIYVGSVFEPHLLRFKAREAIPAGALPPSTSGLHAPIPLGERPAR
ncbi:MAG: hypothetical protein N2170_05900, partial [Bacteroidia bacterium]|nr:hypothetical protein [Bacteroidia bacterium]